MWKEELVFSVCKLMCTGFSGPLYFWKIIINEKDNRSERLDFWVYIWHWYAMSEVYSQSLQQIESRPYIGCLMVSGKWKEGFV